MYVSRLELEERVFLDTDRLEEICVRLGEGAAEAAICTAMEDVAALLSHAGVLRRNGNLDELARCAGQLGELAERIGMTGLMRVTGDVLTLCGTNDANALAATVARMRRLGEQSLLAMWDRQDLTV